MSKTRSAEATIKGFNYQFDASIRVILEAGDDEAITLEGLEDIDVTKGQSVKSIQCKYYEGTKLTNSILREIVEPMLKDYKSRQSKITYFIYGYFNQRNEFPLNDASKFKTEVLSYTKLGKDKKRIHRNAADDISLSMADLESFLRCLKFEYTKKYDPHKDAAIDDLRQAKNCSIDEVKGLYYPNAFTLVSDLATKRTAAERTITKADFLSKIDSKHIIFNHWLLREKEEATYCRMMRRNFFTQTNISAYARFFSIECSGSEPLHEIKELVTLLGRKWSSSDRIRLEPSNRYAPYLILRNCTPEKLAELKTELYRENFCFIDGYPFNGADFTVAHIHSDQTKEHRISVRILNDEDELKLALDSMKTRTRQLYEFFRHTHLEIVPDCKNVRIPITSISMIRNII